MKLAALYVFGVVFLMFFFLFGLLFFILFPHFNLEVVVIAMMVSGLGYVVVAWLMGLICGMCWWCWCTIEHSLLVWVQFQLCTIEYCFLVWIWFFIKKILPNIERCLLLSTIGWVSKHVYAGFYKLILRCSWTYLLKTKISNCVHEDKGIFGLKIH